MVKDIIGVYFDFFGTLIDSNFALTNIWSRIAKKLGREINYDDPRIKKGLRKQQVEADKLGKNYMNFSQEDWDKLNSVILDNIGIKSKGSNEITSEQFREDFYKFFQLNPGCSDTLKQIKAKKIKIGLLTHASREKAQLKMKELKIFEFFDNFIHTQDFGYNKSNMEIYQIALDAMGTTNSKKIFHIGDDIELDCKMAQKIGMTPILFDPYDLYSLDNIITIKKLPELLFYLQ